MLAQGSLQNQETDEMESNGESGGQGKHDPELLNENQDQSQGKCQGQTQCQSKVWVWNRGSVRMRVRVKMTVSIYTSGLESWS